MKREADLPIVDPNEGLATSALERGIKETGFFLLRDRTVALEALHELRRETYSFFSRPSAEKMKYQVPGRGYVCLRGEDSVAGFGTGDYGSGDQCEKFTMGPMVSDVEKASNPAYYQAPEAESFFEENIFPNPSFKQAWETYYQQMHLLAEELMDAIRTVLGFSSDHWREYTDHPVSIMRFLAYPSVSVHDERLGAHYDDDLITILHQSPTANGFDALEVMLPGESEWRSVPADDEMFVVNFGQMMTYLSGGKVVSTKHRVASPPDNLVNGSARSSVAYFHTPNWNARLKPVSSSGMDQNLGQASANFHLEELLEPDGTVLFYKVLQREIEKQRVE